MLVCFFVWRLSDSIIRLKLFKLKFDKSIIRRGNDQPHKNKNEHTVSLSNLTCIIDSTNCRYIYNLLFLQKKEEEKLVSCNKIAFNHTNQKL